MLISEPQQQQQQQHGLILVVRGQGKLEAEQRAQQESIRPKPGLTRGDASELQRLRRECEQLRTKMQFQEIELKKASRARITQASSPTGRLLERTACAATLPTMSVRLTTCPPLRRFAAVHSKGAVLSRGVALSSSSRRPSRPSRSAARPSCCSRTRHDRKPPAPATQRRERRRQRPTRSRPRGRGSHRRRAARAWSSRQQRAPSSGLLPPLQRVGERGARRWKWRGDRSTITARRGSGRSRSEPPALAAPQPFLL